MCKDEMVTIEERLLHLSEKQISSPESTVGEIVEVGHGVGSRTHRKY